MPESEEQEAEKGRSGPREGCMCPGHFFSLADMLGAGGRLGWMETERSHLGCSDLI